MNYLRALKAIIIAILTMIIIIVILSKIFSIELEFVDTSKIPTSLWAFAIFSASMISGISSLWYFNDSKTKPTLLKGLKFGLFASFLGFISDILLLIPYKGGLNNFLKFTLRYEFWLAFLLIIGISGFIGYLRGKFTLKKSLN